ncbi:MAG: rod shape-determining protein [Bacillota bacterium]
MWRTDVAVDLATSAVRVFVRGRGVVLQEPSVVALDAETGDLLAVGQEALEMLGRAPDRIATLRPLRHGVLAHYRLAAQMLQPLLHRAVRRWGWQRIRAIVAVPPIATDVERRAALQACYDAGAHEVHVVSAPLAAAIGAGLPVEQVRGHMVVDVGAGTTDAAVFSMGREVATLSVRAAGDEMDEAIMRSLRRRHNLVVGDRTAQEVKHRVGVVAAEAVTAPRETTDVRGQDLTSGLPRMVTVTANEVAEALREPAQAIAEAVRAVLERTPAELAADVIATGLVLTGGGSLLRGLDRFIGQETGLPVRVADDPPTCVVRGAGKILEAMGRFRGFSAHSPARATT